MRCALNTLTVLALGQLTNAAQPSDKSAANKRALHVIDTIFSYEGIQGDCAALPPSQGPHIEPDTPEAFAASEIWSDLAKKAKTPKGYDLKFRNLHTFTDSVSQPGGLRPIPAYGYNPEECAFFCNDVKDCDSFNLFVIRLPSLVPSDQCPNPPSTSQYVCSFGNQPVGKDFAPNNFSLVDFLVVGAGSNVYNKRGHIKRDVSQDTQQCNGAPIVRNGGFEMDDPSFLTKPTGWNLTSIAPNVTFGFTKPGSAKNGGTYAFAANMLQPDPSVTSPHTAFILSQKLNTCPGTNYKVSVDYRFDDSADGKCSVGLSIGNGKDTENIKIALGTTGDEDGNRPHEWITTSTSFKAKTLADLLAILVDCEGHVQNKWSIDNVIVEPQPSG